MWIVTLLSSALDIYLLICYFRLAHDLAFALNLTLIAVLFHPARQLKLLGQFFAGYWLLILTGIVLKVVKLFMVDFGSHGVGQCVGTDEAVSTDDSGDSAS